MKEFELKYGCNPNQKPARIFMEDGGDLPLKVLNGRPGYINFLDALNAWQLVKELKAALGLPAAASFKHVSPTSGAVGLPLSDKLKRACFVDDVPGLDDSPLACAYARARGTDRLCSFGDWAALSDVCDVTTAKLIKREVSDGVIAPGYEPEALEILMSKRGGKYNVVEIDPDYVPQVRERKQVFGVTFEQGRNNFRIDRELLGNVVTAQKDLPDSAVRTSRPHFSANVASVISSRKIFSPERSAQRGTTTTVVPCAVPDSAASISAPVKSPDTVTDDPNQKFSTGRRRTVRFLTESVSKSSWKIGAMDMPQTTSTENGSSYPAASSSASASRHSDMKLRASPMPLSS